MKCWDPEGEPAGEALLQYIGWPNAVVKAGGTEIGEKLTATPSEVLCNCGRELSNDAVTLAR